MSMKIILFYFSLFFFFLGLGLAKYWAFLTKTTTFSMPSDLDTRQEFRRLPWPGLETKRCENCELLEGKFLRTQYCS